MSVLQQHYSGHQKFGLFCSSAKSTQPAHHIHILFKLITGLGCLPHIGITQAKSKLQKHTDLFPTCIVTCEKACKNTDISLSDILMPAFSGDADAENEMKINAVAPRERGVFQMW